jgi:MAF protein
VKQTHHLILASASPRRRQFLQELGLTVQVIVANIDETPQPGEAPAALVERLAISKSRAVASRLTSTDAPSLIVAADTVVALDSLVLGKPADARAATAMLQQLRNRLHQVYSGVAVLDATSGLERSKVNTTHVWMRNYSDVEINSYVASGDPLDKAGAYAIQHREFDPAQTLDGCLSSVMGLPLGDLYDLLASSGVVPPNPFVTVCQRHTNFACCRQAGPAA